jgi:2-methylcitrate dehydratase PrpD
MAAAAGVQAARLAAEGVAVPLEAVAAGFEHAFGGHWAIPDPDAPAIRENWIKPYPCCLATHSTIEAVATVASPTPFTVVVHPLARQAAALDDVDDGLEAKFSIPYLAAYTTRFGPPSVASFERVDDDSRALASRLEVRTDDELGEWEARIEVDGEQVARVAMALGSPARPLDAGRLRTKLHDLAGDTLDGILDDPTRQAGEVLRAINA